jgi:Flp pilus assembly protein TadB
MKILFLLLVFTSAAAVAGLVAAYYHRRRVVSGLKAPAGRARVFGLIEGFSHAFLALCKFNERFSGSARYKKILFNARKLNSDITAGRFIFYEQASGAAAFILCGLLFGGVLPAAAAGIAAFFIPAAVLASKAAKKEEEILSQMPDAVDLIACLIEGGLSIQAALGRYARNNSNAFSAELSAVVKKSAFGMTFENAMLSMDEKFKVREISGFVNAFIQADRMGSNVRDIIKDQAEELRKKRFQELKKRAFQAPVKLLIPLMLFIFPVIFIVLFGPLFIRLSGGF